MKKYFIISFCLFLFLFGSEANGTGKGNNQGSCKYVSGWYLNSPPYFNTLAALMNELKNESKNIIDTVFILGDSSFINDWSELKSSLLKNYAAKKKIVIKYSSPVEKNIGDSAFYFEDGRYQGKHQTYISLMAENMNTDSIISDSKFKNVRDFGATGNGRSDDTQAIQAAFNSHKNIFFPKGIYRITKSVLINESNIKIHLDNGATISINTSAQPDNISRAGIILRGNNITLFGGKIEGDWKGSVNNAQNSFIHSEYLVYLDNQEGSISSCNIIDVAFAKAGNESIQIKSLPKSDNSIGNISIRNCRFLKSWGHIQIYSEGLPINGMEIKNNYFDSTAFNGSKVSSEVKTGNAVKSAGQLFNVKICNNYFSPTGRMAIEIWTPNENILNGKMTRNIDIENNYINAGNYRTLSLVCNDLKLRHNLINGKDDYIELFCDTALVSQNIIKGDGIYQIGYDEMVKKGFINKDISIKKNQFSDLSTSTRYYGIYFRYLNGFDISDNKIAIDFKTADSVKYAPFNIISSNEGRILNNEIILNTADYDKGSVFNLADLINSEVTANTIFLLKPIDKINFIWNLRSLYNCVLENNKVRNETHAIQKCVYSPVFPVSTKPSKIFRVSRKGGAWQTEDIPAGSGNKVTLTPMPPIGNLKRSNQSTENVKDHLTKKWKITVQSSDKNNWYIAEDSIRYIPQAAKNYLTKKDEFPSYWNYDGFGNKKDNTAEYFLGINNSTMNTHFINNDFSAGGTIISKDKSFNADIVIQDGVNSSNVFINSGTIKDLTKKSTF